MLRRFCYQKHLALYFFSIILLGWKRLSRQPLFKNIVASFTNQELGLLWKVLILGILYLILLLGLAGKRYYYARLITDFKYGIKSAIIFKRFLNSCKIDERIFCLT